MAVTGSIVPTVELPFWTVFTNQFTALFVVRNTWDSSCCFRFNGRFRFRGNTVTKIPAPGAAMVTAALADLVTSATLVAVTETTGDAGTAAGAVYNPVAETVPTVELPR